MRMLYSHIAAFLYLTPLLFFLAGSLSAQNYTPKSLHSGPAWSPDGFKIAYSALHNDNYEIYAIDIWNREKTRVTHHPANDMYPAWSPDGRSIAYYSDRPIEFGPFPPDTVIYNVKGLYETFAREDRKSTRLNSSHVAISYAVFCLQKKKRPRPDERAAQYSNPPE